MFASVSGAFVAHVLLLLFVVVLPRADSAGSSTREARGGEAAPREVTVMMSDLMERLERERLALLPEPDPPLPADRPFIPTDTNRPEIVAPENARYESDRNTSAASRRRPNEHLPQHDAPTLAGDSPLPHLTLANREFVEGALGEDPARPDAIPAAMAAQVPPRSSQGAAFPAPSPSSFAAPEAGLDGGARDGGESEPEARIEAPGLPGEGERSAKEDPGSGSESGRERPSPEPVASGTEEGAMADDAPKPPADGSVAPPDSPLSLNLADDGLFSAGFSPEERQGVINGRLAKVGADAVDAEATPMGRYKKAVRDAISAKWHRYRQDNADFVTWGMLKVEFTVDAAGRVRGLEITKNEANAMLAEFSLRAIRDAELPPMPEEVASSVGSSGLVIQYDIIIY